MIHSERPRGRTATAHPRTVIRLVAAALSLLLAPLATGQVQIVTTTPTLADLARQVGGEHVEVQSIMIGPENAHNVQARPSHMMKLRRADLFIHSGLDGEPWVPLLVKGARQGRFLPGQPGNVDASAGIELKEAPARGQLTRALGDIHVYGNPHFTLDPLNGIIIARTIADALRRTDPARAAEYEANWKALAERLRALTERLQAQLAPYRGTPVAVYHQSWPYFLDRFGLVRVADVEPKPGIAPGPQHLVACVETMRSRGARVVIRTTFDDRRNAEVVAERVGGRAVTLAQEVNALPGADSYEALFELNVRMLLEAFEAPGSPRTDAPASTPATQESSTR